MKSLFSSHDQNYTRNEQMCRSRLFVILTNSCSHERPSFKLETRSAVILSTKNPVSFANGGKKWPQDC